VHKIGSTKAGAITGIIYRFGNGIVIVDLQTTQQLILRESMHRRRR